MSGTGFICLCGYDRRAPEPRDGVSTRLVEAESAADARKLVVVALGTGSAFTVE
jgi:hypothetical protein